jgi:sugar phosphate isomerase/epimerase
MLVHVCASLLAAAQPIQPATGPAPIRAPMTDTDAPARDDTAAEKLGWRLAVQAWTFRDRTAFEAIDATRALGVKYIELYPGQPLSPEKRDIQVGPALSAADAEALRAKLKGSAVRAVNYGVVKFTRDESAARKVFEFARGMGMETITCEPEPDAWDMLERLAEEFGINLAVHDHPKPSRYWSPQAVLDAVKGRSKRLGACADTGHWVRSGLVPAECLQQLEGRTISLHFKDVAKGEDRPWGTGEGDARAMLRELRRQGFRGVFSLEYETGAGKELEADAARCVAFFDAFARTLVAEGEGAK